MPKLRLSERDVVAIRKSHAAGVSQVELARRYGVNQATISRVVTGDTWGRVKGPRREVVVMFEESNGGDRG